MKSYARIANGIVVEIILPLVDANDSEIPIDERFHPDFVANLVDISKETVTPVEGYLYENGKFLSPNTGITKDAQIAINIRAIENALNAKAAERGYTSIKSACAYASPVEIVGNDPVSVMREKFRKEGNALQEWMGVVWATAYMHQSAVLANNELCPTAEESVALMPAFVWPV